jgi:hypothetical protein
MQLGHADIAVTARHYAKWCAGDSYRAPLEVREGEVPADLLARIGENAEKGPQKDPSEARSDRKGKVGRKLKPL